jgi:amino acid permease
MDESKLLSAEENRLADA